MSETPNDQLAKQVSQERGNDVVKLVEQRDGVYQSTDKSATTPREGSAPDPSPFR